MQKKILVIDDSALMRRVLSDIINSDNRFLVKKTANNGIEALDLIVDQKETYDGVILDINMPKMNGLELLANLERFNIKLPIIIVSTLAKEGAKETIRALELGAFDFVTKPESFLEVKSDDFKTRLLERLSLATNLSSTSSERVIELTKKEEVFTTPKNNAISSSDAIMSSRRTLRRSVGNRLIFIACSTGGPKALQQLIPFLPSDLNVPVLLVQHMPEGFTYSLSHRLNELSKVEVKEAEDGDILKKGVVYIAQGGRQMRVVHVNGVESLSITQEGARNGLKPCADITLESLETSGFDDIICVVLTGMGQDATAGIKILSKTKNLHVIAQNQETCTVYGMPKVIYESGLVNEVVPMDKITEAIIKNLGVQ